MQKQAAFSSFSCSNHLLFRLSKSLASENIFAVRSCCILLVTKTLFAFGNLLRTCFAPMTSISALVGQGAYLGFTVEGRDFRFAVPFGHNLYHTLV